MGRKPNQLILEFFERGPKLEDASNRYQHTCRSCGEKFPKGRIDTLTAHLVKKCPALTERDRQRAILQFHDLPDLPSNPAVPSAQNGAQNGQPMTLPFAAPKEGMSALETLAEVSRQHLDLSGKRIPTPAAADHQERRGSIRNEALQNGGQVFEDFLVQDEKPGFDDNGNLHDAASAGAPDTSNTGQAPQSIYQFEHLPTTHGSPQQQQQHPAISMAQHSPSSTAQMAPHPSSLVMAASAAEELRAAMPNANYTMEQPDVNTSNAGISDKFFHQQGRPNWSQAIDPMLQNSNGEQSVEGQNGQNGTAGHGNNAAASYPRPIAMNPNGHQAHFTTDFSINQKPSKPKVRGRFTDSRRKEVQEVRKRGACIRCRMLKKPCSGESPCSTCLNVESARLWKQPCIRTRIAEEFNLYSAGLHSVLAFHSVSSAKANVRFEHIPGRIEATHHQEASIYATFTTLKGFRGVHAPIDPAIIDATMHVESIQDVEIIDSDIDDIGGKLELYMKRIASTFFENETSPFMKPTLLMAQRLSENNKEGLLSKVLELWIATRILVDPNLSLQLFFNHAMPPYKDPVILNQQDLDSAVSASRFAIDVGTHPDSYNLITQQILGATEKRAASLSKFVMNDLERRLLQRQQANPFETFLVSMILLACVERMCWLFKTWESPAQPVQPRPYSVPPPERDFKAELEASINSLNQNSDNHASGHGNGTAAQAHDATSTSAADATQAPTDGTAPGSAPDVHHAGHPRPNPSRWPLDKQPPYYSQQGERFSDILHMLLKMRGVPPKTTTEPITNVIVPIDNQTNNSTTNATINPASDALAKEWFAEVRITPGWLSERRQSGFRGERPDEWEACLVSKILVHGGLAP
ncbi:uncharacterized protein K452DRAFT_295379 [Aplosporella prunicola CBS 121167]|uniref:Zn(2)-C6 fungal-type domain-containing protein n=1 Tax=Aplosporella prunicola CBS 121167 TaxID=1176127 RepID=A0A6A6BP17_9PEZI|nr:uncharacterized protein K452DRAFT_295379 [Aplosporella prunicola CBS 121167]KAF2145816.1 hypothetical protein K452DRAFT_295379 [Aplosporella prunicola CBS 121167]